MSQDVMNITCPKCCYGFPYTSDSEGSEIAQLKAEKEEILSLLKEATEELQNHWFYSDGEGEEYNNDKVIELTEKIESYLAKLSRSQS